MGVSLYSPVTICNLEDGSADEGGKSPDNTSNTSILEGGARDRAGALSATIVGIRDSGSS